MIKCCIFDLDGTVLDTIGTITYYVNEIFRRYGIMPVSEGECNYFAGNGAGVLIERALRSKGLYSEELKNKILPEYKAAYDEAPVYLTRVFPGICELLSELRKRGIKIAVLSNKPDTATKSVVAEFFPDVFDEVIGAVDGVPLKPSPASALSLISRLGVTADEVAWIGDTATDIETAKNLGARLGIGVLWGFRPREELVLAGADVIVDDPSQILREVVSVV